MDVVGLEDAYEYPSVDSSESSSRSNVAPDHSVSQYAVVPIVFKLISLPFLFFEVGNVSDLVFKNFNILSSFLPHAMLYGECI